MAEGQDKCSEDLKSLSIGDGYPADNSALIAGEKNGNFIQSSTNDQEFTENFLATKTSAFVLRNTTETIDSGDSKALKRIYSDSHEHHIADHSSSSCTPFSPDSQKVDICQEIISEGKDIGDLIVGCYKALTTFEHTYDIWAAWRKQTLTVLEQLANTIRSSSKKTEMIEDIIFILLAAEEEARTVEEYWGFRILAMVGNLISKMYGPKVSMRDVKQKELEMRKLFHEDMRKSHKVYIHGLECSTKFEETRKAIRDFCSKIKQLDLNAIIEDQVVLEFLKEISDYNPSNVNVFYEILRSAYVKLIENSESKKSKDLMKVFEIVPDAVKVINLLCWRFDTDHFDSSMTQNAWDEVLDMFSHNHPHNLKEFLFRIKNCIIILMKEETLLKDSVLKLLNEKS